MNTRVISFRPLSCLLALALVSGLLASCDSGPAPTSISSAVAAVNTPPAPTVPPPPAVASGGHPEATVGAWGFSSVSLKVYEFLPDPKGGAVLTPTVGTFATALVTILNNGSSAAHLALSDFQLTDSVGHTYSPDAAANARYSGAKSTLSPSDASIAPGTSHRVGVVFDVPKADQGLVLIILGQARLELGTASP